jgi:hypothetical protein
VPAFAVAYEHPNAMLRSTQFGNAVVVAATIRALCVEWCEGRTSSTDARRKIWSARGHPVQSTAGVLPSVLPAGLGDRVHDIRYAGDLARDRFSGVDFYAGTHQAIQIYDVVQCLHVD